MENETQQNPPTAQPIPSAFEQSMNKYLLKYLPFILFGLIISVGILFLGYKLNRNQVVNDPLITIQPSTIPDRLITDSVVSPSVIVSPTDDINKKVDYLSIALRLYMATLDKKKVEIKDYFTDYKIESIEIQKNANDNKFCFYVNYSLKPFDSNTFPIVNGELNNSTGWVEGLFAQVMVKKVNEEYTITEEGTGGVCNM